MATKKIDQFANIAALLLTESVVNTQTSVKFNFPFSIMDKMGLVINRIEYWVRGLSYLNTAGDGVTFALTAASSVNDIYDQSDPNIIDNMRVTRVDYGAAASGELDYTPFIKDLSTLPGGGLLVAPNPLYGMIEGSGLSSAGYGWIKLFYTYMELAPDEYWQLVESRRIISS